MLAARPPKRRHTRTLAPVAMLALSVTANAVAQTAVRDHVASILLDRFETVGFTNSMTASWLSLESSTPQAAANIELAFPFIDLLVGLRGPDGTAGQSEANNTFRANYQAVMIGAKHFTGPNGLGAWHAESCSVAWRAPGPAMLQTYLATWAQTKIDGRLVATRTFPPGEGYSQPKAVFAAELGQTFFLMCDTRADFSDVAARLTANTSNTPDKIEIADWSRIASAHYWLYRGAPPPLQQPSDPVKPRSCWLTLSDDTKQLTLHLEVDRKTSLPAALAPGTPGYTGMPAFHRAEQGGWETTFPSAESPSGPFPVFAAFSMFGFFVVV